MTDKLTITQRLFSLSATDAAYWRNLAIRAVATAAVVGLPPLVALLQQGTAPDQAAMTAAGLMALGALGSAIITWATRVKGDPNSGAF